MLKKLKSWKLWVIVASCVVVLGAGSFGVMKLVNSLTPISTPQNLCVVETAGSSKYVMVDHTKNASKYEFVFMKTGEKNLVLYSSSNVLDVTELLSGYANYNIKARAIAGGGFGDSKFTSPISYVSKIKIANPTLTLDTDNNRLYVALDESYDFEINLTFELYYNGNLDGNAFSTASIATPEVDNKRGVYLSYFDLSFLGKTPHQLGVIAIPDDTTHFLQSDLVML